MTAAVTTTVAASGETSDPAVAGPASGGDRVLSLAAMPHPTNRPAPAPQFRAAARIDPYWAGMWNPGSAAIWQSRSGAERLAAMGIERAPAKMSKRTCDEAIEEILNRHREVRLAALGAVGMWRTMTDQQLAAIVGRKAMLSRDSADRAVLWASGLLDEGRLPLSLDRAANQVSLYRPNRSASLKKVEADLSYAEWLALTGGQVWSWGAQADRHNLLGTELALRAAEFTENVTSVMGESMGSLALLCQALGIDPGASAMRAAADAVLLREDGMIVAIEITTAAWRNFREKVARWSRILEHDQSKRLAVVFVEASHPDVPGGSLTARETLRKVRKIVEAGARDTAATVGAGVPERMMVASWTDWFPAPGQVDRSFAHLLAHRPTGGPKSRWEQVYAMAPFGSAAHRENGTAETSGKSSNEAPAPVTYIDGLEYTGDLSDDKIDALIDACRSLYGVPHWLRGDRAERTSEYRDRMRAAMGVREVPRLPYYRDYAPVAPGASAHPTTSTPETAIVRTPPPSETPRLEPRPAPVAPAPAPTPITEPAAPPAPTPVPEVRLDALGYPITTVDTDPAIADLAITDQPEIVPGTNSVGDPDSDLDEDADPDLDEDAEFYENDAEEQW